MTWWVHGVFALFWVSSIPVHEGGAHARRARRRRRQGRARRERAPAAASGRQAGGGRLRHHRRARTEAPARPGRMYEVRQVPRRLPGDRQRLSALAARPRPRPARGGGGLDGEPGSAGHRSRASPSTPRSSARSSRKRSGRACSAWRASRSARSASSTSRSSTRCAARSSSEARWTGSCSRRWRRSTRPATPSARRSASAAAGRRTSTSTSRTRARSAAEILWFVGDYASFDPRNQRISQALARVLRQSGVDFGILYDGERTAGNDVRRAGEEGLWSSLAEENVETISGCRFDRILTSDPHTFNTLKNEYPQLGGNWTVDTPLPAPARAARVRSAAAAQGPRLPRHLPRPVHARALQRRLRRAAAGSRLARLRAGRDAAKPRQLLLLRCGRWAHLDEGAQVRRRPAAEREPHRRGGRARGDRLLRGRLPQGRDHVRGRDQDVRPPGRDRAARALGARARVSGAATERRAREQGDRLLPAPAGADRRVDGPLRLLGADGRDRRPRRSTAPFARPPG